VTAEASAREQLFSRLSISMSAAPPPAASSSKPAPPADSGDADIEKLLNREARAFERQIEVERILKAFKLK
jgi:hypothetical protein